MSSGLMLIILVLALAALALVLLRRSKSSDAPDTDQTFNWPDLAEADQAGNEADVDQQVLDQLREAGSDLSKPHPLEFYLYFPTEESAHRAAERIADDGFSVEVKRAAQRSDWMCYVTKRMAPKRTEIAAIGSRFRSLAREFGGEYDGWETEVVK
jgi:hypothetical protein